MQAQKEISQSAYQEKAALLYHAGALGDFITTLPVLDYWKKQHPDLPLVMLGNPEIGKFAKDAGIVYDFLDVNKSRFCALFSDNFDREIAEILAAFSSAIAFANPDSPLIANLQACGITCVFQPPFPSRRMRMVDYHLSLLTDYSKLPQEKKIPRIRLPSGISGKTTQNLSPADDCIAIHPGSGSDKKNWPFERFLAVASWFRRKGQSIVWIVGPAEKAFVFPETDTVLCNIPLTPLALFLGKCSLFVGNDSGITHLAAALGCKTASLFGPSDPYVWAPRGERVSVLYKKRPCSPCHLTNRQALCGERLCLCLNDISVSDVLRHEQFTRSI